MKTADEIPTEVPTRRRWILTLLVFGLLLVAQLFLVARVGTDIPFLDQWDAEGRQLYPAWRDGSWHAADLLRPHNEHRISWTLLLDLGLFSANGQWDPLVQLTASAVLHAAIAAGLMWMLARNATAAGGGLIAAGLVLAYLPHVAWQNALWGFQSSFYFVILFSLVALALLGAPERSRWRLAGGLAAGLAALFALAAGAFVPLALLGLALVRAVERRRCDGAFWRDAWPALVLLALAWALHTEVPGNAGLHAATTGLFFSAFCHALAWPHTWMPAAALVLNLPLMIVVGARMAGLRRAAVGEDFVLLFGGWAVVAAGAMAWTRGGWHAFESGVITRYVDILLLLPIANTWCAVVLVREAGVARRRLAQVLAGAWGLFLFAGWLGLSVQVMRGFILPRAQGRDSPVRLAVAFQQTGDRTMFTTQSPILVQHPNPETVRAVLVDPRMQGALPPSFQPGQPMGPLSRAVRWLLGR